MVCIYICIYIYATITGVYWWDPWHTIYGSTMDPSWDMESQTWSLFGCMCTIIFLQDTDMAWESWYFFLIPWYSMWKIVAVATKLGNNARIKYWYGKNMFEPRPTGKTHHFLGMTSVVKHCLDDNGLKFHSKETRVYKSSAHKSIDVT